MGLAAAGGNTGRVSMDSPHGMQRQADKHTGVSSYQGGWVAGLLLHLAQWVRHKIA